jgi:ABC-2 type transport system permease protein
VSRLAGLIPPGAVVGIFSLYIGVSYLAELLKTLLKLPAWVVNVSIFQQFGTPIKDGISWGPFLGMLGAALVLLLLGVWQFSVRDVDRGEVES